ncbi:hypothetical protein ACFY93_33810 [Streptomyces sp. NPDC008313]|uniref:hypothetical protein n=1 Tax=Streptomyces sp. NPDC008313 TaxID=3364826 RepID=UPI0036EE8561
MSRLGYEKPSAPKEFVTAVDEALRAVVASESSSGALARFITAYNYRRRFSWLPESGLNPEAGMGDGLVCAFRYALASYIPGRSQAVEVSTEEFPISGEVRKGIDDATSVVADDPLSLLQFDSGLSAGGCDSRLIGFQELKGHIVSALEDYYLFRECATSRDPW